MPTHFHLAIWPRRDGELSEFMRLLTVTHANRWHAHHHTTGTGPVYQGRFKSFPIQTDAHASTVLRYIDRNPLRAGLVKQADNWRWGSLHHYTSATPLPWLLPLDEWPVERRSGWVSWVNSPQTAREEQAIRDAMARGRPFGDERWTLRMTDRLKLDSAFRPRGRPKREIPGAGEKAS
jgi:putative transposase